MSYEVGDIVCTTLYSQSILYKIVCFLDRDKSLTCEHHRSTSENPACPDDVHLEVVWKKHKAIAPSWPVGANAVFGYEQLRQPKNAMLVVALSAHDG